MKIAIIGAGISGLTCAYELQEKGHDVIVFEKQNYVGGRMSTSIIDDLPFDRGANFLIQGYENTKNYAKKFKVPFELMIKGKHYTYRNGKWNLLALKSLSKIFQFDALSFVSKLRLIYMFVRIQFTVKKLNFFDLSTAVDFDNMNAYDYAKKHAGEEVADIIMDGFTTTYQFHGAREISLGAMLALMSFMANNRTKFDLSHLPTMSSLPEAIAKQLNVKLNTPIDFVEAKNNAITIKAKNKSLKFDRVVIASTANFTKQIYKNPSKGQVNFLNKVKYAPTINVSYKVPIGLLGDLSILTVAKVVNNKIADGCHEIMKGIKSNGKTLINIALHEDYAKKIMNKSDKEIYQLVKDEFVNVCPLISNSKELENHDMQKWDQAMPKFYAGYLKIVKSFLETNQGDNGVYFCGDYLNSPWIEGSIGCGIRVANVLK